MGLSRAKLHKILKQSNPLSDLLRDQIFDELGIDHVRAKISVALLHDPHAYVEQCVYEVGMAGLKNLFVLDADAIQVLREMPDNSINCIQLYFPDPWQKKRHFKRRFVIHERMQLVEQKLELGGTFHAATDWEPYAEWMLDVLDHRPNLENLAGKGNSYPRPEWRPVTKSGWRYWRSNPPSRRRTTIRSLGASRKASSEPSPNG